MLLDCLNLIKLLLDIKDFILFNLENLMLEERFENSLFDSKFSLISFNSFIKSLKSFPQLKILLFFDNLFNKFNLTSNLILFEKMSFFV